MSRIYWDTMLFVYWLEDHPEHAPRVNQIYDKIRKRGDTLCTSVFTLAELLAGIYKRGDSEKAAHIRHVLQPPEVELLPFNADAADRYGRIRGTTRVSPADAIHLACAAQSGVDLFLTNDQRVRDLVIDGIHFIAGMDVNLF